MAATFDNHGISVSHQTHTLNEDVYYAIVTLLDKQSDVSAFMCSARMLYPLGMGILLRMGASITTDEQLVSFCRFIQRHYSSGTSQLERLSICIPRLRLDLDWDSDVELEDYKPINGAPLLVPVVGLLLNLQDLSIAFCEELLEYDVRLAEAFSALTTLRRLYLSSFGLRTHEIVSNIRSPLVDIHIDGEYPEVELPPPHRPHLCDPLDVLKPHRTTLERVSLYHFDTSDAYVNSGPDTSIFPRVTALAMMDCRVCERDVLVNAFPNLRVLEVVSPEIDFWALEYLETPASVESVYLHNRDEVQEIWPDLDHVYGDLISVYMLALDCPVERLDLIICIVDLPEGRLSTTIEDIRPERIVLRLGFKKEQWPLLDPKFSPQDISRLLNGVLEDVVHDITHFGIDLGLWGMSGEPIHYQRAIVDLLAGMSVQFFTCRVHAVDTEYEDELRDPPSAEHVAILSKFHGKFLAFWAARLAEAAPTLEYLCFRVWDKEVYWHITRAPGGSPQFVRLDVDAGRALVQAERMQWHCGAKAAPRVGDADTFAGTIKL
ncbi:uncharacterized protein TRAVEDRAFT_49113 [Trametes versicolor FP-101664 SS1]|uniref:uncharacterized protein n=1 Tax=Trametes versicolor (strain FP-101664) TaxID=717944 RepID=UPI0004622637|nr:uncharacterized protein TRAVEDRAFT_49113 [Trametes versicolor FP-101664 SS1]EIW56276.1 hypothetical protein TRAVEDRAFT_49113 [Trametes versicolor FP-101664 SS1]